MKPADPFDLKFTSREVTAWGGLALLKRMLDGLDFKEAVQRWQLPQPGSIRGYQPEQLIEQLIVSIWCGAARFSHADITRLDATLVRLFDWGRAAGHKAIVRLFQRFDQPSATRVQSSSYRWLFDKLHLFPITLGDDAGLQPDECVSPYGDATKSSSHSVHAASQGAGCGGVLERPLRQWFQADVSTGWL